MEIKNPRVQKMSASPGEPVPRRIVDGVLNTPVPTIMLKLRNNIETAPTEYPSEERTSTGAPDASSATVVSISDHNLTRTAYGRICQHHFQTSQEQTSGCPQTKNRVASHCQY